jgi:hypothetical protein
VKWSRLAISESTQVHSSQVNKTKCLTSALKIQEHVEPKTN